MKADPISIILADQTRRQSLENRAWPKIDRRSADECWPWKAATNDRGYGRMSSGRGVHLKAHRVAWALANGPIPDGMCILHACDNPPCCNPAHLSLGTKANNTHDMMSKGRMSPPPTRYGERHHKTKLTEHQAMRILSDTRVARLVAHDYGICAETVYRLRRGTTWKALKRSRDENQ